MPADRVKYQTPNTKQQTTRITFVTGTRAEFGLMRSTLAAIRAHPKLRLQIIATGMHLSKAHGDSLAAIAAAGFEVAATVPWGSAGVSKNTADNAAQTGIAMAELSRLYTALRTDVVLVVGDRVEPFAAAAAAHISGLLVAHVHGGDRAQGQVDDALRHAITKLAHLHFPATQTSADRILKLGEDPRTVFRVGSPGLDGITADADDFKTLCKRIPGLTRRRYALLVLHPTDADDRLEYRRATMLLAATKKAGFGQIVVVHPNNDPGHPGIVRCWETADAFAWPDLPRPLFLAAMKYAAVLAGNSSSGIIEAASFGLPVLDIGPRQSGREHGPNVHHAPWKLPALTTALSTLGKTRFRPTNPYAAPRTSARIAGHLATATARTPSQKLIAY